MALPKPVRILTGRIRDQGLRTTFLWALDHAVRIVGGAPIRALSQITPQIHLGGQHNRRGWKRLRARGVSAATESMTNRSSPPERVRISAISSACSPKSGCETSSSSRSIVASPLPPTSTPTDCRPTAPARCSSNSTSIMSPNAKKT